MLSEAGDDVNLVLLEEVMKVHKIKLGEDHPDTLGSMNNLAVWYSEAGGHTDVATGEILQLRKIKLGGDYPDILTMARFLVHLSQGTDGAVPSSKVAHRSKHSRPNFLQRFRLRKDR